MSTDLERISEAQMQKYISAFSLKNVSKDPSLQAKLRSIHKAVYPLFLWQHIIFTHIGHNPFISKIFRKYLDEALSDICQSIILFSQGSYKPACMVLRSAIENIARCLVINDGGRIAGLKNTYELFDLAKRAKILKSCPETRKHFIKIKQLYGNLSKEVHSSNLPHTSLFSYLEEFPKYDDTKGRSISVDMISTGIALNLFLMHMYTNLYWAQHHSYRDCIIQIIPKSLRAKFSGS